MKALMTIAAVGMLGATASQLTTRGGSGDIRGGGDGDNTIIRKCNTPPCRPDNNNNPKCPDHWVCTATVQYIQPIGAGTGRKIVIAGTQCGNTMINNRCLGSIDGTLENSICAGGEVTASLCNAWLSDSQTTVPPG